MLRFQTLVSYCLLGVHVLLLFLLVFQESVALPHWLQPAGRMHPMMLHLPIGFLVLLGILWLFKKEFEAVVFQKVFGLILSLTALSAALAALMGFFLSTEEEATTLLNWHKYTGVGLSLVCYGLTWLYQNRVNHKLLFNISFGASLILMFVTGHFGASITHGEGYLFPENTENQITVNDKTPVFEAAIQPILKTKCYQCHNEQKQKGELLMTTIAGLLKGGKNGPIWTAGDALRSHIIERANLPLEHKEHMPPKGKPQLSPQEIAVLSAWINGGANTKKTVGELAANDPIRQFIDARSQSKTNAESPKYDFAAASDDVIQELNNPFRAVFALANESPALQADFFVRSEFKIEQLAELSSIKEQLVGLNLSNMPIGDDDLKTIVQFKNLEKLILTNTDITGKTLSALGELTHLKTLSLSGTKINTKSLEALKGTKNLKQVFVWNTAVTNQDLAQLNKAGSKIKFELGYVPKESEMLKLNAPILVNENFIITDNTPITFKHPLRGVTIRYTTDGSTPDSTKSTVYQKFISLNNDYTQIKAIAIKDKWLASGVVEYSFFKAKYRPNKAEFVSEPNPQYKAKGPESLIDLKKGEPTDFKTAWLGFRETHFESFFSFDKPTPVKSITFSTAKNIGTYVMPPTSVEFWGGADKNHLKLLQKITPPQAQNGQPNTINVTKANIPAGDYQVFKIIARPLKKLPEWHGGKGQPAWIMVDEVLFN